MEVDELDVVRSIQSVVCSVQCAVYSVKRAVKFVLCTLCSI